MCTLSKVARAHPLPIALTSTRSSVGAVAYLTFANCDRRLLAESYAARILEGVPLERIHRSYEPGQPPRTVMCTCDHYTAYVDRQSPVT